MPAILQQGVSILCPHGGTAQVVPGNTRVRAGGTPALLPSDTFTIVGCAFTLPNGKPQPCISIEWLLEARQVTVSGTGPLTESSVGLCKSAEGIPQGPASVVGVQTRSLAR